VSQLPPDLEALLVEQIADRKRTPEWLRRSGALRARPLAAPRHHRLQARAHAAVPTRSEVASARDRGL